MLNPKYGSISRATVDRLPLYFRTLRLIKSEGSDIVSSEELGRRIGVTPEQIRKDLAGLALSAKRASAIKWPNTAIITVRFSDSTESGTMLSSV